MKYIFSLTTIPSKFDNLYLTLNSLINQTIQPHKIIINLPKKYGFRFNGISIESSKIEKLTEDYKDHNVLINVIEKDMGPGTKLLGLFFNNVIDIYSMDYVVLVDDDLIYNPDMVENFKNFTLNKHIQVASYHTYSYKNIIIGQGADGFFIKPNLLTGVLKYYNNIKDSIVLTVHDDFYFSFYFKEQNALIHKIPYTDIIYIKHQHSDIDALTKLDGSYKRKIKSCYTILMKYKENNYYETSE